MNIYCTLKIDQGPNEPSSTVYLLTVLEVISASYIFSRLPLISVNDKSGFFLTFEFFSCRFSFKFFEEIFCWTVSLNFLIIWNTYTFKFRDRTIKNCYNFVH